MCVALAGGWRAAQHRPVGDVENAAAFVPSADVLRIATLGHPSLGATLLWMYVVSDFATGTADAAAIEAGVLTCGQLDPQGTAPWVYGSLMLAQLGDIDGQQRVLKTASEAHPEQPWYAFSLGQSFAVQGDLANADVWLQRAASAPNAPAAYIDAYHAVRSRL